MKPIDVHCRAMRTIAGDAQHRRQCGQCIYGVQPHPAALRHEEHGFITTVDRRPAVFYDDAIIASVITACATSIHSWPCTGRNRTPYEGAVNDDEECRQECTISSSLLDQLKTFDGFTNTSNKRSSVTSTSNYDMNLYTEHEIESRFDQIVSQHGNYEPVLFGSCIMWMKSFVLLKSNGLEKSVGTDFSSVDERRIYDHVELPGLPRR